jgi:hypothetical protein
MIKQVFQNEHPRCSDGDPLRSAVFGPHPAAVIHAFGICFLLSRKLRKSAKIVYNGLEIKNHITKERM